MTVKELNTKLQAINLQDLQTDAVSASKEYLAEVNRLQLRKGQKADGANVGRYSPGYGAYKATLSTYYAPTGVPDLYLSGTFHKSIKATVSGRRYDFNANDPNDLIGRYGESILGINETHKPLIMARVTKEMGRIFKQLSGL